MAVAPSKNVAAGKLRVVLPFKVAVQYLPRIGCYHFKTKMSLASSRNVVETPNMNPQV